MPMTAGDIYTVAGDGTYSFFRRRWADQPPPMLLDTLIGLTVDGAGNTVDRCRRAVNCRIRVVAVKTGTFYGQAMTAGDIYTVAGSGGCQPPMGQPHRRSAPPRPELTPG